MTFLTALIIQNTNLLVPQQLQFRLVQFCSCKSDKPVDEFLQSDSSCLCRRPGREKFHLEMKKASKSLPQKRIISTISLSFFENSDQKRVAIHVVDRCCTHP
jgi:hypothetical protein